MTQQQKIGKMATTIRTENNDTIVTYHNTDVVRFNPSRIILNTGGYYTATTKIRMNQTSNQFQLGFRVYQQKHKWFAQNLTTGTIYPFIYDTLELQR